MCTKWKWRLIRPSQGVGGSAAGSKHGVNHTRSEVYERDDADFKGETLLLSSHRVGHAHWWCHGSPGRTRCFRWFPWEPTLQVLNLSFCFFVSVRRLVQKWVRESDFMESVFVIRSTPTFCSSTHTAGQTWTNSSVCLNGFCFSANRKSWILNLELGQRSRFHRTFLPEFGAVWKTSAAAELLRPPPPNTPPLNHRLKQRRRGSEMFRLICFGETSREERSVERDATLSWWCKVKKYCVWAELDWQRPKINMFKKYVAIYSIYI